MTDEWKSASVVPVHKKEYKSKLSPSLINLYNYEGYGENSEGWTNGTVWSPTWRELRGRILHFLNIKHYIYCFSSLILFLLERQIEAEVIR